MIIPSHHHDWKFTNWLIYAVAILKPVMTLPQVIQIWSNQSAAGVSLLSWGSFLVGSLVWLSYAIKIKSRPLIITSALWVVMETLVVSGILLFR